MRCTRAVASLVAQRQALMDAKAVLLVNDRQPEIREDHAFLHQGMGANDNFGAVGNLGKCLAARLAGDLAGQPDHPQSKRAEPMREVAQMLLGQQFGWRHHCGLHAGIGSGECRNRRNHGLARADIALDQAQHRLAAGNVVIDFREYTQLRLRQLEWKRFQECLAPLLVEADRRRRNRAQTAPQTAHADLVREQFVEREATLRRMRSREQRRHVSVIRRCMHQTQGSTKTGQLGVAPDRLGHHIEHAVFRQGGNGKLCKARQRRLPKSLAGRIYRRQRALEWRVGLHTLVTRMHHLHAVRGLAHFAIDAKTCARGKPFGLRF